MTNSGSTELNAFDNLNEDEIIAPAMTDPDVPFLMDGAKIKMRMEDGATVLERFRKAIKRERQNNFYDAETLKQ